MTGLNIVEQDFYTHGSYASQLAANYRVICDLMLRLSARFCQFDVLAPNMSPATGGVVVYGILHQLPKHSSAGWMSRSGAAESGE